MKMIGIIGSRRRNTIQDFKIVEKKFLELYEEGDIIVSGGCKQGGDRFAYILREKYCTPYLEFPANWNKFGKKIAGFVRNKDIAKWSDILIACVSDDRTGGTESTINLFLNKFKKNEKNLFLI